MSETKITITQGLIDIATEMKGLVTSMASATDGDDFTFRASNIEEVIEAYGILVKQLFMELRATSSTKSKAGYKDEEALLKIATAKKIDSTVYTNFYDEPQSVPVYLMSEKDTTKAETISGVGVRELIVKIFSFESYDAKLDNYVKQYITQTGDKTKSEANIVAAIKAVIGDKINIKKIYEKSEFNKVIEKLKTILHYFTVDKKQMGSTRGVSSLTAVSTGTSKGKGYTLSAGGGGLKGGAYLKEIEDLQKNIERNQNRMMTIMAPYSPFGGVVPKNVDDEYKQLQQNELILRAKLDKIISENLFVSKRINETLAGVSSYKINENEFLINKAIEALNRGVTDHKIITANNSDFPIPDFEALRNYIMENTNDPVTILLRLTNLNPINLDDILPSIIEDTFTIKINDKGILEINDTGDGKVEMPNPLGNKINRQEYNKKFKANTCYGFGGPASSAFCVSLLNYCLASDKNSLEKCKSLFASKDWGVLKDIGIQNTNIFLIKEFLLKIGYPRINDTFNTEIDSWFDVIKTRYDLESDKSLLTNIQHNDKLKEVITDMVTKYNKIIKAQRSSRNSSSTSLKFHLPRKMKGGDNDSILNTNLYELNGGRNENLINFSSVSPSEKIYNIFKELVKDQNITNAYKNFFDKMEKNIESNNHNLDADVKNHFSNLLRSFKESEGKLNKLLQTMHNFAWFLGKNIDSTTLSDEEKKLNAEARKKLDHVLSDENIQAYNAAREKLLTSLNTRSKKMIAIAASHPMILIASS